MRLIDADALSAMMAKYIEENRNASDLFLNGCADGAYHYQFAVDHAQTIEERKTGKWVLTHNQIDWGWDINCSVCGKGDEGFFARSRENAECKLKHQYLMDAKKRESMRYCNYCGAKMEVGE